jgi:hypothetical protein
MGLMVHGLNVSIGKRLLSSQNQLCSPPSLLFDGYSMTFTNQRDSPEVKNKWRYNITPIIGFVCCQMCKKPDL